MDLAPPRRSRFRRRAVVAGALLVPAALALTVLIALRQLEASGTKGATSLSVPERLAQARVGGEPAPSFALPSLDGTGIISLRRFSGVVVLNFWASWCTACREEAPELEAAWRAYAGHGVRFVGIDHSDTRDDAVAFQRQFGITYPSAFDPKGELATEYGLIGIPTTFVIDGEGRMRYRFLGKVDAPLLEAAIDRVIQETP